MKSKYTPHKPWSPQTTRWHHSTSSWTCSPLTAVALEQWVSFSELTRNARSWAVPQTNWIRNCFYTPPRWYRYTLNSENHCPRICLGEAWVSVSGTVWDRELAGGGEGAVPNCPLLGRARSNPGAVTNLGAVKGQETGYWFHTFLFYYLFI